MKYMGSKARHANSICPIIQEHLKDEACYIEPFVGGCNIIDRIDHPIRIGQDINKYLITMWKELQNGWIPPDTVSEEEYIAVKTFPDTYPQYLVGFVGIACSYGAKWFGGYARSSRRNYCAEGQRSVLRQVPKLKDIIFNCLPYNILSNEHCVYYCDPPYRDAVGYGMGHFDHDMFWDWCNREAEKNTVLVSEYTAPEGWECIWKSITTSSLTKDTGDMYKTERLFINESSTS